MMGRRDKLKMAVGVVGAAGAAVALGVSGVAGGDSVFDSRGRAPDCSPKGGQMEYGPSAEEAQAAAKKGSVLEVFQLLGAPFAMYEIPDGERTRLTVYRWGHGEAEIGETCSQAVRDEFLLYVDQAGMIVDSSYKNKFTMTVHSRFADTVMDVPT